MHTKAAVYFLCYYKNTENDMVIKFENLHHFNYVGITLKVAQCRSVCFAPFEGINLLMVYLVVSAYKAHRIMYLIKM